MGLEIFAWGCVGGALDELLHWAGLRRESTFPTYLRSPIYWIITILLVIMGGIVAYLVATSIDIVDSSLKAVLAGFVAPALLKKFAKAFLGTAALGASPASARPSWRTFLSN